MEEANQQGTELKRQFMEFLDQDRHPGNYATKIGTMLGQTGESKAFRLPIDLADLRSYDIELHRSLLNDPQESLPPFEQALEETVSHRDPKWLPEGQRMRISLVGEFGAHTVSPRNLMAPFMSKIVNVQGIVTKASLVRPKMVKSVHFCRATDTTTTREYRDVTSHDGDPTGSAYPTKDDEGNLLETEFGLCQYRDNQASSPSPSSLPLPPLLPLNNEESALAPSLSPSPPFASLRKEPSETVSILSSLLLPLKQCRSNAARSSHSLSSSPCVMTDLSSPHSSPLFRLPHTQMLTIQELPETAPPGQLPRSVEIIMEEDLVDSVKPGDRVEIAGIYKAVAPMAKGSISGVFKAIVCGIGVKKLTKEIANHLCTKGVRPPPRALPTSSISCSSCCCSSPSLPDPLTPSDPASLCLPTQDLDNIKRLAKDGNILKVLGEFL